MQTRHFTDGKAQAEVSEACTRPTPGQHHHPGHSRLPQGTSQPSGDAGRRCFSCPRTLLTSSPAGGTSPGSSARCERQQPDGDATDPRCAPVRVSKGQYPEPGIGRQPPGLRARRPARGLNRTVSFRQRSSSPPNLCQGLAARDRNPGRTQPWFFCSEVSSGG